MMSASFREYLNTLEQAGEMVRIPREVDLRYVSALIARSEKAILFEKVSGYSMPVTGGLLSTRERLALAAGEAKEPLATRLRRALDQPVDPVVVSRAPVKEVVITGDEVDLGSLPLPVFSVHDGAPYISCGVITAKDPQYGMNTGMYRLMLRDRKTMGIDIVTPNNLRAIYQKALNEGKGLEISISLGVHPYEMIAATYKAALGINELAIAGGLHGRPVSLVRGETIAVEGLADAEIVLEGEILPVGWTYEEGRFCEFPRLMGGMHMNPLVRIRAITHRKEAIFYALHMPWENIWMSAPIYEAAAWRVLREAGVDTVAVNITPGGCCHWHVVASIRKHPGDGKNAIMALLSIADIKHVTITDDDIDIFDPVDVEWAVATRVQADRDVIVISHARAKPLDPSLPPGVQPLTTAKMGIDATIPEGVPKERYERIVYPYYDQIQFEEFTAGKGIASSLPGHPGSKDLPQAILESLRAKPLCYSEILETFREVDYASVVKTVGLLTEQGKLIRDAAGRYKPKN
jgi:2,5-furandicarboxylate decarboxylase 1